MADIQHLRNPDPVPDIFVEGPTDPANKEKLAELENQFKIIDREFMSDLRFLVIVRQLIVSHKIKICSYDEPLLRLSNLRMLQIAGFPQRIFWKDQCRAPTKQEREDVENRIIRLEKYLPDQLIVRAGIKHISGLILEKLSLWLLTFSILFLIGALLTSAKEFEFAGKFLVFLIFFTLWSAAVGALGSVAFLYVNALSIQVDPKVDMTSRTFVTMRIILGALFGVILTSPFECTFHHMQNEAKIPEWGSSLLLLLPFLLGFSTPLVLSIMGHLIQSAQAFFGLRPVASSTPTYLPPARPILVRNTHRAGPSSLKGLTPELPENERRSSKRRDQARPVP